jgi:hypothetical protein
MPAKKFIRWVAGRTKEFAGIVTSAGAANDGDIPALDASGKLDITLMPAGIGQNTGTGVTSEALAVNDIVNIFDNAGTPNVRKADATVEGKEAVAFVKAAFASGATATYFMSGNVMTGLTGLVAGRRYLGTVAGTSTATAPSATGNVSQKIGDALTATTILFEPEEPITLA